MVALLSVLATLLGAPSLGAWALVVRSPLAAILLVLLCAALLAMEKWPESAFTRPLTCAGAAVVASLSLGLALGHLPGGAPTFERWLLQGRPFRLASLWTDVALLGAALSFLCRWLPIAASWRIRQTATLLALVPLLIGVVVLLSNAVGAPQLYGSGANSMSLPAAVCCLALGFTLHLVAGCDTWPLVAFRTGLAQTQKWSILGFTTGALTLFLVLGTLILAGGSFYLRAQIQHTRARVEEDLSVIATAKVRQISAWMGERRSDAEQIARSALIQTQLRRFLAGSPSAPPEGDLRAWMEEVLKGSYRRVVLFDARGRARIVVPPEEVPDANDLDEFEIQRALGSQEVMISDLHRHPGRPDIHLGLWVPIGAGTRAKAEGTLLLMVDPQQFLFPLVQSWPTVSSSAETLLVRRDGDEVLFLNDLRQQPHTALNLHLPFAAKSDLPAVRAVLGEKDLMEGKDYRGVPVLAVAQPIPGTDWHMVAKVDVAEVYGPLRRSVWLGVLGLLGTLALAAAGLGLLLHRHDADLIRKQLHLSHQFEGLMRGANDIIFVLDGAGHILEANAQAVESYGYTLAELQTMRILDLRLPDNRTEAQAQFDQVKASGSSRFETTHRRKDGSTFPVEVSSRALPLDGELRLISFVRDITERKAQEHELLRMTQLYAALSQVNQAIVWSQGRQALFDKICEVMVEFGRCRMAWIGLHDPVSHRVEVASRYGDSHALLDRNIVRTDDCAEGYGAVGTAIRQASPCLINDYLATAKSAPWQADLLAAGLLSIAAFPIREGGEVCGALVVYGAEKDFFGTLEAGLLEEAALDISFAMDHLAGEGRRQQAEAALQESERFLRAAQEAGGIGIYAWDIPGDRWKSSSYLDRIFGIDETYPRNLQGWMELVAPDFRERMQAYVAGIMERREAFDLEYPILRKLDGELRWLRGTGEFQWDEAGRPVALMGVIRDITERRQARAALKESEEKFSKAFHASPDSVNINRLSDGVYVAVNDGFTRISGYSSEEVLGRSSLPGDLGLWVHAEDRQRLQEGLRRDGRVVDLEAPFRRKDGTVLTGLMSASLVEIDGEPCVLSIVRDITQLRAQTRQLERMTQMYAALSQVNQAIVFSPTREVLLDKICEVMLEFGQFRMAWIGWNDPVTHEVQVVSHCGDEHGYLDGIGVRSDDTVMGRGPTGRAIREGVPQVENDFLGNSDAAPWHEAAVRCGYAALASFPIRQDGEVRGALTVYSSEQGFFGIHEVALLEEAAGDVSFALDHLAGEARRREMRKSLRTITVAVEQSPLSIVITDPEGTIEYVNPRFTEVTRYTSAEAIGQNPRILKSPATPPEVYRRMWATLARGEVWVGELENLKKGGEPFHERATIAPVRDAEGHVTSYIAIKEDITGLKRDQEERRSLEAQLHQSQKLESLGSLAGGVAHDMNNVLGAILSLASALREHAEPFSSSARNLDTIMSACMRGRGVVKSLLYFAQKDLQEERPVDLNELVREMSQLLSHLTLQRVGLTLDLQENLSLVRGDAGALSHALMNLCVNAIDAMPKGGSLRIQTTAVPDGGLTLRVQDTGEGMAPDVLAKAMEPFFTTKPRGKGTGLGLAMVYGTMKAHEGTFLLRSQPGEGTEAVLRFPPNRLEKQVQIPVVIPSRAQETPQARLKILLVDDDELIRESVAPMLEILGHRVTVASGGAQALQLLENGMAVDLVILDMNMPGMSGAEALPRILDLCPGMPVLMATGYSEHEIAPLMKDRPTVSSLRKPFSLKEIKTKIAALGIKSNPGTSL
jgi:PAS domain S-box-containing protein